MQARRDDGVSHRQCNRAVAAGDGGEPFVGTGGGVGQAHVEIHQLGPVVEAATDDSLGSMDRALVRFVKIGTEVDDVFAALEVARLPIGFAQAHVVGRSFVG